MEFLKLLFSPQGSLQRIAFLEALIYSFMFMMLGTFIWSILMMILFGSFTSVLADHAAFVKAITEFQQSKPNTYKFYFFFLNYVSPALLGIIVLAFLWLQFCAILKRLEDINLSRWLVLIPYFSLGAVILYSYFGFDLRYVGKFCVLIIVSFVTFLLFMPSQKAK